MTQLTMEQALQSALQHHQAGRLPQAEMLYRQVLQQTPQHAAALHYLGVLASQVGRMDLAMDLIRQSIASDPRQAVYYSNLGSLLLGAGKLDEVIQACRQAIALQPNLAEAHSNLGHALRGQGQLDAAIAACRQAITLNPNQAEAWCGLADALKSQGQMDAALAAYRQALALKPDYPDAYNNFGNALKNAGQRAQALAAYRQALVLKPNFAAAYNNLAKALADDGQMAEAIDACQQAIALNPNLPEAHCNLGQVLAAVGQLEQAVAACRQAIALKPDYADAYNSLGNGLHDQGRLDEAAAAYRQALTLQPDYAEACNNLGNVLKEMGQIDAAIALFRQALALRPNLAEVHANLGSTLKDQGQLTEAIATFRHALALHPDFPEGHSNLVFDLHYHPGYDAPTIAAEYRNWNRQHAVPLQKFIAPHANDRNPERRLRVGYVSPDLRLHAVGRFLEPLLAAHDKQQVEVFAYAHVPVPDALTQRLRAQTAGWRSIVGLSDAAVADLIRQDQIDILVDLAMHTAYNRLLVFARKAAPVQATYLAYCSSTGLDTIDYRLSDPYLDPPGMDESIYSEQTLRLPATYWCYQPGIVTPEVNPLPARESGHITFGCLNNFCKVSEPVFAAWARLLHAVPDSQLLLHALPGAHRLQVHTRLKQAGIAPQRVHFAEKVPLSDYFALYHRIDIALDTFPYGGGTTTCDALWMGCRW